MSSVDIRNLSTESITDLAIKISNVVSEIDAAVNAIQQSINATVPAIWDGTAALTYRENWERDYTAYRKQITDFENLVQTLKKAATDTETVEQGNTQLASYH